MNNSNYGQREKIEKQIKVTEDMIIKCKSNIEYLNQKFEKLLAGSCSDNQQKSIEYGDKIYREMDREMDRATNELLYYLYNLEALKKERESLE